MIYNIFIMYKYVLSREGAEKGIINHENGTEENS